MLSQNIQSIHPVVTTSFRIPIYSLFLSSCFLCAPPSLVKQQSTSSFPLRPSDGRLERIANNTKAQHSTATRNIAHSPTLSQTRPPTPVEYEEDTISCEPHFLPPFASTTTSKCCPGLNCGCSPSSLCSSPSHKQPGSMQISMAVR